VKKPEYINVGGRLLSLESPLVMGVINITPDSFFKPSRLASHDEVLSTVSRMLSEGASIIDVGGVSTRPGASPLTENEEKIRIIEVLKLIRSEFPDSVISLDTYRASVAREAFFEAGINIINDISGGTLDENMFTLVRELNIPYIMMHIRGTPEDMQTFTDYEDVVTDIINFFGNRVPLLKAVGVKDIIIDPGIGFGKTVEQNFSILNRLSELSVIGLPILLGLSRKSLISKVLDVSATGSLNGTTALNMVGLMNGASILRVHDVAEAVQTVQLFEKVRGNVISR